MSTIWGWVRKPFLFLSILFLLSANGALGQATPRVVDPVDNRNRVTLSGNVHPLARAEFDRGAVDNGLPMTRMLLLLKRSEDQEAALQTYMEQQQDKNSANHHVWLTPQQFGAQYGPADADTQAVTQWLGTQGFRIEKVYSGKTVIEFSGSAGQVQAAFGATIRNYQVNGKMYVANANDPQIPAALVPVVAGIVSLNNFPRQSHVRLAGRARKIAGKPGVQPLYTFPFGTGNFYGLAPGDFATIYNSKSLIASGNNGSGQTVAIVGETNINVADVQAFRQMFGLPATFSSGNVILNGEDPGITSTDEETEADLDVQWSGAVAPGATVDFVISQSTPASQGIDLSALYIIEYNLAGVMSESYGACEAGLGSAGNAFYNSLWEQAAAQGITAILSAGDGGSAACDDFNTATEAQNGLAVSGMASTPFNVALGGTDFDQVNIWSTYWSTTNATTGADVIGTSALSYIPEIPWSQNCAQIGLTGCGASAPQGWQNIVAGSGGASNFHGKPNWQLGVAGMPNDSHRDLPDVSLFASPGFDGSGYIICQSDANNGSPCNLTTGELNFLVVGGTSASAPAFAGVMALVNQKESTAQNTAPRQGNANYVLYALAKKSGASCASIQKEAAGCVFNDITHGNSYVKTQYGSSVGTNSVPCKGGSLNCSVTSASETGVLIETTSSTTEAWTVTTGYDLATGLGSVNINNLATNWGTVSTVATTTTLTLSPTTGITHGTGENVTVNISVTPKSGTATGDVSLIATIPGPNGSTTQGLDQFTLNTSGKVVSGTTTSLPGGTDYQVYAHYAGDGTNAPSDSTPVTVSVNQEASQTFIVVPTYNPSGNQTNGNASSMPYGSLYIISMYATDKNAKGSASGPPSPACYQENALTCPSGSVTLTDNGTALGTGGGGAGIYNLNNGGYTQILAPNLLGGIHTLTAAYSGDGSYLASTSTTDTLTITAATTQMSMPYIPYSPVIVGTPVSVGSSLITNLYTGIAPTGTITFYDGTTAIPGTVTYTARAGQPGVLDASISGSIMATFTSSGTHSVTAHYSGDANYAASNSSQPSVTTVLYPTTMTTTANSTTINYGSTVTVTAKAVSSYKNPAMTGQIQFLANDGTVSGSSATTLSTDGSGNQILTATLTITPQDFTTVQAFYPGDANFQNSSNSVDIFVNIPDFTLPATAALAVTAGKSQTVVVNVTPLSNTPSTVAMNAGTTLPSGMSLSFAPSTVNLNGAAVPVTITVATTGPSGGTTAAVSSQVREAGIMLFPRWTWWTASLASGLIMLFLLGMPSRRKRYKAAFYAGTAFVLTLVLGCGGGGGGGGTGGGGGGGSPAVTTVTLTTSSTKIASGTPFTLTATVTSTKAVTGTVNIFQGNQAIAPPIQVVNGLASFTMQNNYFSPGTYQFWANYSGDANNLPSQTTTGVQEVFTGKTVATYTGQTGGLTHQGEITITLQ